MPTIAGLLAARRAMKEKRGPRQNYRNNVTETISGNSRAYTLDRLQREHPTLYARGADDLMQAPLHRCSSCQRLVSGRCPHCQKARDKARPNAASRGYCSDRWRRFRAVQLSLSPLCVLCEAAGRITAADCVDHVRPIDGPHDPRFLDFNAVQSLCSSCHSKKTATEDSSFARRT